MKGKIFNHVGITINISSDIKNFYVDILGLEIKNKFTLSKTISNQIFNIEKNVEVVIAGKEDFTVELFIAAEANYRNFQHICITVNEREKVIRETQNNDYPCYIIKRDTCDIVFIKDKSNNLFEIKKR